jgi:hypothetical protein
MPEVQADITPAELGHYASCLDGLQWRLRESLSCFSSHSFVIGRSRSREEGRHLSKDLLQDYKAKYIYIYIYIYIYDICKTVVLLLAPLYA